MKAPKILVAACAVACVGLIALGAWVWQLTAQHSADVSALAEEKEAHARQMDKQAEAHAQALADQQASHERIVKALTDDFEKKLDGLRKDQQQKLASAFKEFESIFDGNKRTIDYINALEERVRAGQAVSKAEVEKLALIATGISFLQKEYQKPFQQFTQLQDYLARQAAVTKEKPEARFGFFKRLFSKEFREAQKDYERSEAARQAFADAQSKFASIYAAAQAQMSAVQKIGEEQVRKLYALIDDKNQDNQKDLSTFFDQARKALKTHQSVLDFTPDKLPDLPTKPAP